MPDNLSKIPPEVLGIIMAVVISLLRVLYDKEETRPVRMLLEGAICGSLSFAVSAAIKAAGLNPDWSVFAGAMIGYLGSQYVKSLAIRFLDRRASK